MALADVSRLGLIPPEILAKRFAEVGLTAEFVRRMAEPGDDLWSPLEAGRAARLMDSADALLLRLLFCREAMEHETARGALGDELSDALLEGGVLVDAANGCVTAPFHLRFVRGLLLFSDYLEDEPDAVMGAGETTAILYEAARPPRRLGRALDLGCGAGTLALLLADSVDHVVATDVTERAVTLGRFNARVNGIGNVEFRAGDVYAPVAGERFDLIASQPPYYPNREGTAPDGTALGELTFLHGGERGDEVAVRVVEGAEAHLTPEGRTLVFVSWPEDHKRLESAQLQVLELTTGRSELYGARQTLTVIDRCAAGQGWSAEFRVPADCWGFIRSRRIDQLLAAERLLRGPVGSILAARLRLAEGATLFREGEDLFLGCSRESLVGMAPVDAEMWRVISAVNGAADVRASGMTGEEELGIVVRALRRGLLVVEQGEKPVGEDGTAKGRRQE